MKTRVRSIAVSVLLSASLAAGLAVVPAIPASAACSYSARAYNPYRSGSYVRSKIAVSVSCAGYLRVSHWVQRNGSTVNGWDSFYPTPYSAVLDRVVGTCRSGNYKAFLGVNFSGSAGQIWQANRESSTVFISC